MWQSEIYSISSLLAFFTPEILSFAFVQLIANLHIYTYIHSNYDSCFFCCPLFLVFPLDRTFGHGANCCFPQFFQKKKSKEQKREKGKKMKASTSGCFQQVKRMVEALLRGGWHAWDSATGFFQRFLVPVFKDSSATGYLDFQFKSSKTDQPLLIQIAGPSFQILISDSLSRFLFAVFRDLLSRLISYWLSKCLVPVVED